MSIFKIGLLGKSPPGKIKDIMNYLTRSKVKNTDLPEVTTADKITIPSKKQTVEEMEAVNAFMKRNPRVEKAGGGMLVQPGFGGTRQGYKQDIKPPTKKQLEITEKVYSKKYGKTGIDLWESLKQFERSNIRQGHTTGETFGLGKLKKNQIGKDDFIKLVNANKDKTYNEFVELLKDYKTKDNKPFTKNIIADRLRAYGLSGSFKKEPAKGRSEESIAQRREAQRLRYYDMLSTEEGKAKIKEQRIKSKAKEYQIKGMDPPANTAKEMLWKDTVKTAKDNPGNGRFTIASGYEKSMNKKNFYSGKIKILDNRTGKTFTFNTLEKYINKNSKSFNVLNFNEVMKPYKQKQYINDKGLRNAINQALIPNYNTGMSSNAFTIQHDFGRQNNPFKVSLAFYDDNLKEYKIRSDFEKAWEKSKTSKTPLADRKLAFNVFKQDIDRLNIRSSPSMVKRDRFFGQELDLKKAIQLAKKEGAIVPRGTIKDVTSFIANLDNPDQIKLARIGCPGKATGGRIGYFEGQNLTACATKGAEKLKNNPLELTGGDQQNLRALSKSAKTLRFLKNFLGPGAVVGELIFEGGVAANKFLNEGMPIKQALGESYINKYLLGEKLKINLEEERKKELLEREMPDGTKIMLEDTPFNIAKGEEFAAAKRGERMFLPQGEFAIDRRLKERENEMKALYPQLKDANLSNERIDEILKEQGVFSPFTLGFGMQQMQPGIGDTKYNEDVAYQEIRDLINQAVDEDIQSQQMQNIATAGGVANLAGGGIAGLSGGVDQGPQRTSMNPDSQGLQGLMKRVRNR